MMEETQWCRYCDAVKPVSMWRNCDNRCPDCDRLYTPYTDAELMEPAK